MVEDSPKKAICTTKARSKPPKIRFTRRSILQEIEPNNSSFPILIKAAYTKAATVTETTKTSTHLKRMVRQTVYDRRSTPLFESRKFDKPTGKKNNLKESIQLVFQVFPIHTNNADTCIERSNITINNSTCAKNQHCRMRQLEQRKYMNLDAQNIPVRLPIRPAESRRIIQSEKHQKHGLRK